MDEEVHRNDLISAAVGSGKDRAQLQVKIEAATKGLQASETEIELELQRIEEALNQRDQAAVSLYESQVLEDLLTEKLNILEMKRNDILEEIRSLDCEIQRCEALLQRMSQITSMNDAFHIWFEGPYGTINNFKMGTMVPRNVDVTEQPTVLAGLILQTDTGFGQVALLLDTIANASNLQFKHYLIQPMGSTAKIIKADDRRTIYPLYIEQGPLIFFPKRNFNLALTGFLSCVQELGDYAASYDPTMTMPHRISFSESKIGDVSFVYGVDDEVWTKALKFMLTNIKWIVAWYTKHGRNFSQTI